jgi:hypothetical protein
MSVLDDIKGMSYLMAGDSPEESLKAAGVDVDEWARCFYLNSRNVVHMARLMGLEKEFAGLIQFLILTGALLYQRTEAKKKVQ